MQRVSRPIRRPRCGQRPRRYGRRAFNLLEMLIALAVSSALLTATMVALNASFVAYQRTTEVASTHTIGRLAMQRMLTLIRTGKDFGPFPLNPLDRVVQGNYIEFETIYGDFIALEWIPEDEQLDFVVINPDTGVELERHTLLQGVVAQEDADGETIPPFTLEYEKGFKLYRATIDLTITPDDDQALEIEGENVQIIRLVASAMPRNAAY